MVLPVLAYRLLRYGYTFRRIPLTQGKYAIVDPDDYWHLSKHKWHANGRNGKFYAVRTVITKEGKRLLLSMHRCILKVPNNIFVDHINRNSLDNRKANIRPATRAQNSQNRAKFNNRPYSSKYKGVTWNRRQKCWQAQIHIYHKLTFLGRFNDEVHAAKAYDRAAKRYHRQFASLNFPITPRHTWRSAIIQEIMYLVLFFAFQLNACFSSRSPRHSHLAVAGIATHSPTHPLNYQTSFPCHAERKRSISFGAFEIEISNLFRISIFGFAAHPP